MAFLAHLVSRMQADIEFLVQQNAISPADGQIMSSKLPGQTPLMPTPVASPPMPMTRRGGPPPPAPQASKGPQARSMWPYNENGQEAGDLSFSAEETIEILEETNADWWKGRNKRGETGLFPSNYVEKLGGGAPPYPSATTGRMAAPVPSTKTSYDPMPAPPPEPPVQGGQQQEQPPKKNKFGKYGNTMAHSAAGGVGFGAGAAIGGGLVRAIF